MFWDESRLLHTNLLWDAPFGPNLRATLAHYGSHIVDLVRQLHTELLQAEDFSFQLLSHFLFFEQVLLQKVDSLLWSTAELRRVVRTALGIHFGLGFATALGSQVSLRGFVPSLFVLRFLAKVLGVKTVHALRLLTILWIVVERLEIPLLRGSVFWGTPILGGQQSLSLQVLVVYVVVVSGGVLRRVVGFEHELLLLRVLF